MTGVSPWAAPPETAPQVSGFPPSPAWIPSQPGSPVLPPPRPPRRSSPWMLVGGVVVLLIAVIAATAAVTHAVDRNNTVPNATPPAAAATPAPPQFSAADQAAAKQRACNIFDESVRGVTGTGGMRENGQPNLPVLIRAVNGALAVQNALTPAVPEDLAKVAHRYVDQTLDATTAAMGGRSIDEVNHLIDVANDTTDVFADACGLPH
jgi:hypothetical protein